MITRVKGSYVIGYNGADHEIIRDGEVVYENDTIIYVGKHYEGEVSKTEDAGNAVIMPGFIDLNALGILTMIFSTRRLSAISGAA